MPCSSHGSGLSTSVLNVHSSPEISVITPSDRQENRGSEKLGCLPSGHRARVQPMSGDTSTPFGHGGQV